jgi:hypothetical protein
MEPSSNHKEGHLGCDEFMEKVVASLDGGLSREEELILLVEIPRHPCCLEQINIARCYKTFLAQKVSRQVVDPSVIEAIKAKVRENAT